MPTGETEPHRDATMQQWTISVRFKESGTATVELGRVDPTTHKLVWTTLGQLFAGPPTAREALVMARMACGDALAQGVV